MEKANIKQKWGAAIIPLGILLLNITYKILFLDARDIRIDEPFTIFYSQMSWLEIFHMLPGENNPPLYFLLMHAWIKLFGIEPFQVRSLSLVFGALSSVLIYFVGKRNFSVSIGITSSLLYTFSNFNTYLAQEARVYSFFVFLTLASAFFFLELLKEFKTKTFTSLIVTNILLIYSHFFAFWLLLIEFIFIFLFPDTRKKLFKPLVLMMGILFVAYLPYLMIFVNRLLISSGGTWLEQPTISSLYNLLWKFCNQPVPTVMVIIILFVGFGKYIFLRTIGRSVIDKPALFLIIWFLLPVLLTFSISFALPVFYEKYLVFISPALYLLVCKSVEFIAPKKSIIVGIFLILTSGFIISSTPKPFYSKSISSLTIDIKAWRKNSSPIVINPGYFDKTFIYYYNRLWFKNYQIFDETLRNNQIVSVVNPGNDLPKDLIDCDQVFMIEAGSQYLDPTGNTFHNLLLQFDSVQRLDYDDVIRLYIFRKGYN